MLFIVFESYGFKGFSLAFNQGIYLETIKTMISFLEDQTTIACINLEDLTIRYEEELKQREEDLEKSKSLA